MLLTSRSSDDDDVFYDCESRPSDQMTEVQHTYPGHRDPLMKSSEEEKKSSSKESSIYKDVDSFRNIESMKSGEDHEILAKMEKQNVMEDNSNNSVMS